MDMDEVEAVVEATEEVGVAAARAEACDLRKTSLTETTLARITYFPYTKLIDYLFNTRPNAKFEDVLDFNVNDMNVIWS